MRVTRTLTINAGAPSFVTEPPSDEIKRDPSRLEVCKDYVRNIARWLGARAEHNATARARRRARTAVGSPRGGLITGSDMGPTEAGGD